MNPSINICIILLYAIYSSIYTYIFNSSVTIHTVHKYTYITFEERIICLSLDKERHDCTTFVMIACAY